jgi:uncharacterized protein YeaO (DUF488 family)
MITISRAYDPPAEDKGVRILVDRLWPRGISKERLNVDKWMREIAPSYRLIKWYSHDPKKWNEFRRKYFSELDINPETKQLLELCKKKDVVFVFSSKEREINNAVALKEYVTKHI